MAKMKVGQVWARLCVASCLVVAGLLFAGCQTTGGDSGFSQVPGMETASTGASPAGNQVAATSPSVAPNPATGANAESYEIIQPGNILLITFADLPPPPLGAFDQRVRDDGTITLIYNQVFHATGKRTGDLEKEIHDFYVPRYFINLTVTVRISSETRSYYVDGEVRVPSKYPYTASITVSKAIAAAGGFTDFANKRKVQLIRPKGGTQTVNYNNVLAHPELDPQVFPEDRIHVKRRLF
jgi:protein involved in polysaccharide export with SLBB domain